MLRTLESWRRLRKEPADLIRACSTLDTIDGVSHIPIGLAPVMWWVENDPQPFVEPTPSTYERRRLLYVSINTSTDAARRGDGRQNRASIAHTLEQNGFPNGGRASPDEYWYDLRQSHFVASPEGNGIDCHRTYEALWAGAIPIVEEGNRSLIEQVYGNNLPILWTRDYSEITADYLYGVLAAVRGEAAAPTTGAGGSSSSSSGGSSILLNNTQMGNLARGAAHEFDFSRLCLSTYTYLDQELCRLRSTAWHQRTVVQQ